MIIRWNLIIFIMWIRNTRWLPLHEIKPCWTNLLIVSSSGTTQCIINHTWINSSLHCFLKWYISIGDLRQSILHRYCWKIYKTCYMKDIYNWTQTINEWSFDCLIQNVHLFMYCKSKTPASRRKKGFYFWAYRRILFIVFFFKYFVLH